MSSPKPHLYHSKPKVKSPTTLKDYKPISLCNVLHKLISKVLANRVKKVLHKVISPNQSAFIPDKLITDNIIVTYEMLHFMKTRQKGIEGSMAIVQSGNIWRLC